MMEPVCRAASGRRTLDVRCTGPLLRGNDASGEGNFPYGEAPREQLLQQTAS